MLEDSGGFWMTPESLAVVSEEIASLGFWASLPDAGPPAHRHHERPSEASCHCRFLDPFYALQSMAIPAVRLHRFVAVSSSVNWDS